MISRKIAKLDEQIINQIKAGEVIERPANVLKELLENSIDANARNIKIQIVNGGLDLISVIDDGDGIDIHDLPKAFERHATSKITNFDDLYRLSTFGFRGEALPSIASISKLSCTSVMENGRGGKIILTGGIADSPIQWEGEKGTSIFVKELFYNTPARLKFIKSNQSEKNSINRTINSYIISNPEVNFSVKWDDLPPKEYSGDLIKRFTDIAFKGKGSEIPMLHFSGEYEEYSICGHISLESTSGSSNKLNLIFANGRPINEIRIHQIITNLMREVWREGESSHYVIFIKTPNDHIDVNVHPNKTMVKFYKSSLVYSMISSSIRSALGSRIKPQNEESTSQNKTDHNSFRSEEDSNEITNKSEIPFTSRATDERCKFLYRFPNGTILFEYESELKIANLLDLSSNFVDEILKNGLEVTPLLISIPYKIKASPDLFSRIEFLKDIGIETTTLDNETLLVKSIPSRLTRLPYRAIIDTLISCLISSDTNSGPLSLLKISISITDTPDVNLILTELLKAGGANFHIKSLKEEDLIRV